MPECSDLGFGPSRGLCRESLTDESGSRHLLEDVGVAGVNPNPKH